MKLLLLIIVTVVVFASFNADKNRYFLVVYSVETGTHRGNGNIYFKMDKYPSMKFLKEQASIKCEAPAESCVITNIIELKNKEDFDNLDK